MAPLRRYIRLTPHTTIQTLIFLEDPSILHTWLIHPTNAALPRIVASLKDLVLPKLREERERERNATGASKKPKIVKDVVVGSDFEVSVYFKDGTAGHALVVPRREFLGPKLERGMKSNSSKMVLGNDAMNVGELGRGEEEEDGGGGGGQDASRIANLRIENEDEDDIDLHALPLHETIGDVEMQQQHEADVSSVPARRSRRSARTRGNVGDNQDNDAYHVSGDEGRAENEATTPGRRGPRSGSGATRRNKGKQQQEEPIMVDSGSDSEAEMGEGAGDPHKEDKKKPLFRTKYEGYSIYGKTLYLIVKRLDTPQTDAQSEGVPSAVVRRDIPIAPGIEDTGTTDDVMEGWMYMSQAIREDPDF
ncbi:hypothetical protein H072_2184 [Dactylellina haptotyla CBS 200.50]|uniref:Uncharacterized protein n=1 Tax=Dactylellina haptotyla (strain CBS 200.50) TaxID=1284197 RepID=S8ALW7_DACHA|nr:hypothetical protein H072_2184 [Dactylellina haptotyla CBS 200.50]